MNKIKLMQTLPWTYPKNIKNNIEGFFKSIRNFYYRGRYGVAPNWDCWDFDSYILDVFKNGLEIYKKETIGYPGNLTFAEWQNVLNRMEELIDIIQIEATECEKASTIWKKQDEMSKEEFDDQWWGAIKEWDEYRQDCMDELCDLMKEYFHHLWW